MHVASVCASWMEMLLAPNKDPAGLRPRNPEQVERVDLLILGPRQYPVAPLIKLPASLVGDLPDLLAEFQKQDPTVGFEAVMRAIVRLGMRRLRLNILKGVRLAEWDRGAPGNPR